MGFHRAIASLALLLIPALVQGQGYVGGFVLDSATNEPLQCVQVALLDTAGHVVARQLTMPDGAFQMEPPSKGTYQLRFSIWGHETLYAEPEEIDPALEQARKYSLVFRVDPNTDAFQKSRAAPDAPPGRPVNVRSVQVNYPETLRSRGVEGEVVVHFVVDSTGRVPASSVRIARATHFEFREAVRKYLIRAQLEPALQDHRPVCSLLRDMPFTFTLVNGEWDLLLSPP
jgi:TonB family protein